MPIKNFLKLLSIALLLLTAKSLVGQNEAIIRNFLNENRISLELSESDIQDWIIYDNYNSNHNGVSHVYLRQRHNGIEIYNAVANFNIKDGRVISMGDRFFRNVSTSVNSNSALIGPIEAIRGAAAQLNLNITETPRALEPVNAQHFIFSNAGISKENIPVKLMYQPGPEGELMLAWDLSIYQNDGKHWWSLRVDAQSGKILDKVDWVISCNFDHKQFGKCDNPNHNHSSNISTGNTSANSMLPEQYRVFPEPVESPNHGVRSLKINPRDSLASPYGWHDTNGANGAEFTITRGNNVFAYEDRNDDDAAGYSPDGTAALNFDFPLNLTLAPQSNEDAAITNLFYWNNLMHDMWYRYGFTEAAGNFQQNNYGRGGLANDYVNAEAQDGGGTNNANFATPTDGTNPRMQMYLWTGGGAGATNLLTVNSPSAIAGVYTATQAAFGPGVPSTPITANLVLADDGTAPTNDGCTAFANAANISGKIALVYRGNCNFAIKVANAQAAGALAVIVVNNVAGAPINMGGTDPSITIPSIMVSDVNGAALATQLANGQTVNVTIVDQNPNVDKDGDFDNVVIAHEYGHGISTRLTGGPSNSNCLNNAEQMGEGWSDFFGLMMTIEAGDTATDARGIGTYASGEPVTGGGIRNAPYCTDMTVNPFTYDDVNNTANVSEPHGIGFVWCTMLWDLNWAMIDRYGFNPDLFNGNGGNNKTMQLVIDGLKLQPCSPGFVDGRNAILAADSILYGGANQCLIWEVFARRGLGFSANQGSSGSRSDQTEAFDLPSICQVATALPNAVFNNTLSSSCRGTVFFTDQSTSTPQTWSWNFGDGNSSTSRNPTHTYNSSGTYTVTLIVSNTLGADTSTATVNISLPALPTVNNATICAGQAATLNGTASGDIVWYNANGTAIDTGLTFISGVLTTNSSFFAENVIFFPAQQVGALNGTIGTGGYHNNAFTGAQNFTASKALTILSAWTDAGAAGARTFYIWNGSNASGSKVDSVTVNLAAGQQRVTLNLEVPGPGVYSLGASNVNLFRNNAGASYPYTIPNLISITSSSATTNATTFWYYLYDWEVAEAACRSPRVPVNVTVEGAFFNYSATGLDVQFSDASNSATSWAWDFGDGSSSTDQNPQHSYNQSGTYVVSLIVDGNVNCPYTTTITINLNSTTVIEGTIEASLMPNPANSATVINFNNPLKSDTELQLIAVDGKVISNQIMPAGTLRQAIELDKLSAGMYFIRLRSGNLNTTLKLSVNK
jgi:PKD repeat protein